MGRPPTNPNLSLTSEGGKSKTADSLAHTSHLQDLSTDIEGGIPAGDVPVSGRMRRTETLSIQIPETARRFGELAQPIQMEGPPITGLRSLCIRLGYFIFKTAARAEYKVLYSDCLFEAAVTIDRYRHPFTETASTAENRHWLFVAILAWGLCHSEPPRRPLIVYWQRRTLQRLLFRLQSGWCAPFIRRY